MSKFFSWIREQFEKIKTRVRKERPTENSSINLRTIVSDLFSTKSILSRMVLVFLLLIIIPVTIIGFIATNTASKNIIKSAEDSLTAATKQASDLFDIFLEKAVNMSMQTFSNPMIQEYLEMDPKETPLMDAYKAQEDAASVLRSINSSSNDITAKIVNNQGTVIGDVTGASNFKAANETDVFKTVLDAKGKCIWINYDEFVTDDKGLINRTRSGLSLGRLIKSLETQSNIGIVIVDVSYSKISDFLSNVDLGFNDDTYLMTDDGRVLSSGKYEAEEMLAQKQFVKKVKERCRNEETGLFPINEDGRKLLVAYTKSSDTGMTIITVAPYSVIYASSGQIVRTTILTGIIFVLLAVAFGFVFSFRMTKAMKSIMGVMSKAEEGDLSVSISLNRNDEIGKLANSFNHMLVKIRELILQNKTATEEVVDYSNKMASISSESSRISSDITHAIAEVAIGSSNQVSEIEASVRNVSQLADRISLAVEKKIIMEKASETMKSLSDNGITTIGALNEKTAQTNEITLNVVKEINQLNQYVKNINVITNVLRNIADQTNLLAINAAIEAARAGDSGRGFAVVADEIRKLAEQSNSRTRDIQKHIENIFRQAQSSTNLVAAAEASFREQSDMVSNTAEVFNRINKTIASLVDNINQLGSVISDMDSFKEMVLSSMENISEVSEEVSASTQEVSASTQEQLTSIEQLDEMSGHLNELAGNLLILMKRFKF